MFSTRYMSSWLAGRKPLIPLTSTVRPGLVLVRAGDAGLHDHAVDDPRPVVNDLCRAFAGEDQQPVGGVVVVDVELDRFAHHRLAAFELLEREHALAAAAGHLDEDVVAVNADDHAGLSAAGRAGCRVSARFRPSRRSWSRRSRPSRRRVRPR